MKVIIDLIEDIHTAINNDKSFSLASMGLKEEKSGEFFPSWESGICSMKVDDAQRRLFLFLGKDQPLYIGDLLEDLNALSNEKMMYEVCVSYSKKNRRYDNALIGFAESFEEKKYFVYVSE